MKCEYCDILDRNNEEEIIYQDDDVVVAIKDLATITGQVTVFPKKHFTILEMVPEDILQKCAIISNKVGMSVFDGMACQGTNLLVQNGLGAGQKTPHFGIEVIPRREEDGLNLQWESKQLQEDEIETTLMTLQDALNPKKETVGAEGKEKEVKIVKTKEAKEEVRKDKNKEPKKENYLLKSLRKKP
ncbi:hypothetical protein COY27_02750 [Candidatus Woesearchaeota archaeon CG_4_10_14_0_2_um_filter_33_13]|nr:MAG: hypothetical protein COY27_02750 [Candidatus Woesearchaeota archaeon CG_4_10_14_0_2_um_filter_33_13]